MDFCLLPPDTECRAEVEVKRSRFICLAARTADPPQARAYLADVRHRFPNARHYCSAYVISADTAQGMSHSSDDGEPAGTAGRPILEVLQSLHLTDTQAVVVRYFGGTLLGTGGLVRAYTAAAQKCFSHAPLLRRVRLRHARIRVSLALAGKTEAGLRTGGYLPIHTEYTRSYAEFGFAVTDFHAFSQLAAALSAGGGQISDLGTVLREVPLRGE